MDYAVRVKDVIAAEREEAPAGPVAEGFLERMLDDEDRRLAPMANPNPQPPRPAQQQVTHEY